MKPYLTIGMLRRRLALAEATLGEHAPVIVSKGENLLDSFPSGYMSDEEALQYFHLSAHPDGRIAFIVGACGQTRTFDDFAKAIAPRPESPGPSSASAEAIPGNTTLAETARVIKLPCHDIVVTIVSANSGTITSNLHDGDPQRQYRAAVDSIESLVLAHACAGIDIAAPAYVAGIETAVDALANAFN